MKKMPPLPPRYAEQSVVNDPLRQATQIQDGTGQHKPAFGIYRGFVEFNRDPERRGRVKVRVPELDGPEYCLGEGKQDQPFAPTMELPWAEPCFGLGGGKAFGSFSVPTVGAAVFVMFVGGSRHNPVWLGGWPGTPPKQVKYGCTKTTIVPPYAVTEDGEDIPAYDPLPPPCWTDEGWMEEQGPDVPREAREQVGNQPDVHVLWKTLKGASLIVNERDTIESTVLADRYGAELRFDYPTTSEANNSMGFRRSLHSATQHDQLDISNLFGPEGVLALYDPVRQGITIRTSQYSYDKLDAALHDKTGDNQKVLETQPERLRFSMDRGDTRIRVEYVEDQEVVAEITLDLLSREITIRGLDRVKITTEDTIELDATTIRVRGNLDVDGHIDVKNEDVRFIGYTGGTEGVHIRNWKKGFQTESGPIPDIPSVHEET